MPAVNVFSSTAGVSTIPSTTAWDNKPRATMELADGTMLDFPAIDVSRSSQAARIQVEAAADGSMYATGCVNGVGQYTISFLDGVQDNCGSKMSKNTSVLQQYLSLNTLQDRKVTIRLYKGALTRAQASSAPIATFRGLLHNIGTDFSEYSGGAVILLVTLTVIGGWEPSKNKKSGGGGGNSTYYRRTNLTEDSNGNFTYSEETYYKS